jgi:Carbohydrate esterase 2 N-terminal
MIHENKYHLSASAFTFHSMKKIFTATLILFINQFCLAQTIIKCNDPHLRYMGRLIVNPDSVALSWPGSSIDINFRGTGVKAMLWDEHGENYFKVIVDGKVLPDIQMDSVKHLYTLVSGLPAGKHHLELFKRTEWVFGKTWFYQFDLDPNTTIAKAPPVKKRKIEFYGNSITCGYAVFDTTGQDRGTPPFQDNYLSYAAITARHFNANYSCIARSGIGILISWFPQIMPEMYNRLYGDEAEPEWDFSKYTPNVVVINLFQNDSWLVLKSEHPEFKHRFGTTAPTATQIVNAYQNFAQDIRSKYPNAYIICALGSMDATKEGTPWPGYITKAVNSLHDKKITTLFFPYKNTPGHPQIAEQQAMANELIRYINKNIKW